MSVEKNIVSDQLDAVTSELRMQRIGLQNLRQPFKISKYN